MDIISAIIIAVLFLVMAFFLKSGLLETISLAAAVIFYMLTTRYARGITERGVVISGGNFLFLREYRFSELKQVNVSNDGDLVSFAIVVAQRNFVDIQRYPKELKPDLVKIFKDNNVIIIYK